MRRSRTTSLGAVIWALVCGSCCCSGNTGRADWFLFGSTNAVSGVHNASVKRFDHVPNVSACQTIADSAGQTVFTWHDHTVQRGYALACILRLDGVWNTVAEEGHYSGIKTSGPRPPDPPQPPAPTPPSPQVQPPPCSLNGELAPGGGCVCDPGWKGPICGQLDMLPAPPLHQQVTPNAATSSDNAVANSTWGISVVGPFAGLYHGYMTEIANECLLGSYGIASQVVHMTAPSPLGPWQRVGVALDGFAHNPQALVAPNGSIILFHIGELLPSGCLANCTSSPNHTVLPRPVGCPTPSHALSVAVADGPDGPFRRFPYILDSPSQPGGPTSATNPSAMLLDSNGTILLTYRRATSGTIALYRGACSSPQGPWIPLPVATLHATTAGSASTFEEDPFLFQSPTRQAYHMLTHREVAKDAARGGRGGSFPPLGPWLCGGGHVYSRDLVNWFYGENVYGSPVDTAQCEIAFAPSAVAATSLTSRQRPVLFRDSDKRVFLYAGASVNQSEYIHSFTLVQELYSG